jgi:transcriptional repressor NrdR
MRCPHCSGENTQVKDSRPTEDNTAIRRRRICPDCDERFTTFERVQLRELIVVKRSGDRVPFDREKLAKSVHIALRKRPIDAETVEMLLSNIVRDLEGRNETEIQASIIGAAVMAALKDLDPVAYVRFASVYRDFREVADFQEVLGEIAAVDKDTATKPGSGAGVSAPASQSNDDVSVSQVAASAVEAPAKS